MYFFQLLDYYQACVTYYHQGFDLCNDFDIFFKSITDDLNALRGEYQKLEKVMQNRHMSVNSFCDTNTNSTSNKIEGYLFKKKSKGFKTWCRRWFYLSDNQLVYRCVSQGTKIQKKRRKQYLYPIIGLLSSRFLF